MCFKKTELVSPDLFLCHIVTDMSENEDGISQKMTFHPL